MKHSSFTDTMLNTPMFPALKMTSKITLVNNSETEGFYDFDMEKFDVIVDVDKNCFAASKNLSTLINFIWTTSIP